MPPRASRLVAGPPLIELQGLTKNYRKNRGVGPLDLTLPEGIHGLLGPNGSGKTTLIKTLLGFHGPTGGKGFVLGHDIVRERLKIRRLIGFMAENDVLVPGLTPVQSVRLAAELCGLSAARAHEATAEAMHAVQMGDERYHAPQRLSTGQRQKVKLAAALVHAPKLLFLDEPTNGLDPRGRSALLDLISEVSQEKSISVILSTHILPDVEKVCHDAVVLRNGQLVAIEQVGDRAVRMSGAATLFQVDVMGDSQRFIDACRKAKLEVQQSQTGLIVAAPNAQRVLDVARETRTLLSRMAPSTEGVEDAVLVHLEAA